MFGPLVVACVRVGTKYGIEYVEHLQSAVRRHLHRPYQFVCITDNAQPREWRTDISIGTDWPGWWAKMALFTTGLFDQRVIYLDLDTLVVGDLEPLADLPHGFYMLRDFHYPHRCGSGVMVWDTDLREAKLLYNMWKSDPQGHMAKHQVRGDQEFIQAHYDGEIERLQDHVTGILSAKVDLNRGAMRPPADARLVCFHGAQKPHNMPAQAALRRIWLEETP